MKRPIKAWMYDYGKNSKPTINVHKPYFKDIKYAKDYGVKVYEVEIIIKKELK